MHITLIEFNGVLIGKTFQDRWNLLQLGFACIERSRNQASLKRLRRANTSSTGEPIFTFSCVRGKADTRLWGYELIDMLGFDNAKRFASDWAWHYHADRTLMGDDSAFFHAKTA